MQHLKSFKSPSSGYKVIVYEREVRFINTNLRKKVSKNRRAEWDNENYGASRVELFENQPVPERATGDIRKFSRKSRMRLFRKFNRLNTRYLSKPVFITCTASPEVFDMSGFQEMFQKKFLPFLRDKIPEMVYLWRLEPHKSGQPHYHLMLWSGLVDHKLHSEYWKKKIRKHWRKCIDDHSRGAELHSCKIKDIDDIKQMTVYLSKYLAKEDDDIGSEIRGRRWGVSSNFPESPITAFDISYSDEKRLWEIAEHVLRARGKQVLADRIAEFRKYGWSLWIPAENTAKLFEIIGHFIPRNALESYGDRPPPDEIEKLWDLIPENLTETSSPQSSGSITKRSARPVRPPVTGSLFPAASTTHRI